MPEKFIEGMGSSEPEGFEEEGVEMQEAPKRTATEILRSWPKGLELQHEKLFDIARETGEQLSEQVTPVERADGWYIHIPNGQSYLLARHGEVPPNKYVYLVYNPAGSFSYSSSPVGVDVRSVLSRGPDFHD